MLTAKTNEKLEDIIPRLNTVSGLPVVDANNRVIGVISRKVSVNPTALIRTCSCMGLRRVARSHLTGSWVVGVCVLKRLPEAALGRQQP